MFKANAFLSTHTDPVSNVDPSASVLATANKRFPNKFIWYMALILAWTNVDDLR